MKVDVQRLLTEYFVGTEFNIIRVNKFSIGYFFHYKDRLPLAPMPSLEYLLVAHDVHLDTSA